MCNTLNGTTFQRRKLIFDLARGNTTVTHPAASPDIRNGAWRPSGQKAEETRPGSDEIVFMQKLTIA